MHVFRVTKKSLRVVSALISWILGVAVRSLLFPKAENYHEMLWETGTDCWQRLLKNRWYAEDAINVYRIEFDAYLSAIEEAVPENSIDFVAESSLSLLSEPHRAGDQKSI